MALTVDVTAVTILWKFYIKRYNLKPFIRMAKQFASQNGIKSQQTQHQTRMTAQNKQTKTKLAKGLVETLPFGGTLQKIMESQGISGEEIFNVMQEPNFVKGIMVIVDAFGGVASRLTGKPKEGNSNEIPPSY